VNGPGKKRNRKFITYFRLFLTGVLIIVSSCGVGERSKKNNVLIPEWVIRTPTESGRIYAVGISGPTYFPEDGKINAADQARKELAKSLGGKIQSVLLVITEKGKTTADEAAVISATSWATEIVLENSQILEIWIDQEGVIDGSSPGTTYALGMVQTKDVAPIVTEKLKSALPDVPSTIIQKQTNQELEQP